MSARLTRVIQETEQKPDVELNDLDQQPEQELVEYRGIDMNKVNKSIRGYNMLLTGQKSIREQLQTLKKSVE